MLKYFSLVLDLLNIPPKESYLDVAQYMVDHSTKKLCLCHPYGFLFSAFAELLQGKITEDQFVALGDVYSHQSLQPYAISCTPGLFLESLAYGCETSPALYSNTLYIVGKECEVSATLVKQLGSLDSMVFAL